MYFLPSLISKSGTYAHLPSESLSYAVTEDDDDMEDAVEREGDDEIQDDSDMPVVDPSSKPESVSMSASS